MLRLLEIVRSPRADKKWRAIFSDGTKTDFGATGYRDYTQHKDSTRAASYRARHRKDLDTGDPRRAGFLSYYILWDTPDFNENVRRYKNRFHM
ncbi:hypothetical protein EBZ39_08425 [bacterium]|nr:hypothetical protein [bacterium]